MRLPSLKQAETLLAEAEQLNPGAWVPHVRNAALAAKLIASRHPDLDEDAAYIMGLMHDIGRREGRTGMRHTLDGYLFMQKLGYEDAARICLTHSFPYKDIRSGLGRWDVTDEEYQFVKDFLEGITFTTYDRLLQLCDAIALAEGICLMEKRLVDAAIRLGVNDVTQPKWQALFEIKQTFEDAIGSSIYAILPGVVETTFA
jgi:hypothetical protein